MANARALVFIVFIVFSLTIATVMSQTFQYSHGWTNGKRSSSAMLQEVVNSVNKNAGQLDSVLVKCELKKLILLLQGNVNHHVLQVPCELFGAPKRILPENMVDDHFYRQLTSTSNNY